jgi:hypothetical protein
MNGTPPATLFAIATAVAAIGSLAHVSPAQAYPSVPLLPPNACAVSGYQFPAGTIQFVYPGIGFTRISEHAAASMHVDAPATTTYDNGTSLSGSVFGDIIGHGVDITVRREGHDPLHLVGIVGTDNHGRGSYDLNGKTLPWSIDDELSCVPASAAAPPPVLPAQPTSTASKPLAGTSTLGTATVVADTDMYDKPDGLGQKIGTLFVGEQHPLMEACRGDWCRVGTIELGGFPGLPNGTAWVYAKGFLTIS